MGDNNPNEIRYALSGGALKPEQRTQISQFLRTRHANITEIKFNYIGGYPTYVLVISFNDGTRMCDLEVLLTDNVRRAVQRFIPGATITRASN